MKIKEITENFYAQFCCVNSLQEYYGKITFISSEQRNEELKGFGCRFPLYCLSNANTAIIAYSPILEDKISKIKEKATAENIKSLLKADFSRISEKVLMIFDKEKSSDYGNAKILNETDYKAFEVFFRRENPNSNPDGWLEDYFMEKVKLHYLAGYYRDAELISVCDAPDMPYMQGVIQHTGISTLEKERRKGYAKKVCSLATHNLISLGICPQWETGSNNFASIQLAKSIGYEIFANAYIIEDTN